MTDDDFQKRRHRQFDLWKDTWVKGTGSADEDPIFVYGHMIKYLIEPDHTPFLDLLGGGGFIPHAHGNRVIGEAMSKMAGQAYQTSERGDHAYAATAEFMTKVEEHLPFQDASWRFASSESEAFLVLMEALASEYDEIVVVNGPTGWPHNSQGHAWSNTPDLHLGSDVLRSVSSAGRVAFVVYPVNPETFELVSTGTLAMIDSLLREDINLLVWDTSVTAGWMREPLDVHPHAGAVLLGGALGGGLPFGAVVSRDTSLSLFYPESGRWSATAGNALACQLGLHALLLCEGDDVRDRYDLLVAALGKELEDIQLQLPEVVREIVGGGLLGGFRLSSVNEAERVVEGLRDRGVLVGSLGIPRGIVTFRVSRSTDPHDVSELFDKVFEILTESQT